ncbi:hypothetical protein Tco_0834192, partial [Tanacetum coccineum]
GKDPFTRLLGGEPGQNHQLLEKKNGLGNVDVRKRKYTVDPTTEYALISVFHSFPANLSSVMALSSSPYALPTYLSPPLLNILSLCLRSTFSAPVVLFYGIGPYYLLPQSNVNIRSLLTYTPL